MTPRPARASDLTLGGAGADTGSGSALVGTALDPFLDLKTPLKELLKTESSQHPTVPGSPSSHGREVPRDGETPPKGSHAPADHAVAGQSKKPEPAHGKQQAAATGVGHSSGATKKERLEGLLKALNRFRGLLEIEQSGQIRYDHGAEVAVVPMALRVDQSAYKRAAVKLADLLGDIGRPRPPVVIQSVGTASNEPGVQRQGFFSNLPLSLRVIERLNPKPVARWEGRLARGRLAELDPLREGSEADVPLTVLLCTGIDPEHRTLKLTPYALDFALPEAAKLELRRGYFVNASIHNRTGDHLARARVNLDAIQPQSRQPFPWILAVYDRYLVVAPYLIHHFGWPGDGYYSGVEFSALFRFAPERADEVQSAKLIVEDGDLPRP
jgi:hypothetical protein